MISHSISRSIIAIIKLASFIAMTIVIMGCPPEPADMGNGGGNGGGGVDDGAALSVATVGDVAEIDEREGGGAVTAATFRATAPGSSSSLDDVVYTISEDSDEHPFVIMGDELVLPEGVAVDYEASADFAITILALAGQEQNEQRLSGFIEIVVPIVNLDDEAPVFGDIPDIIVIENETTMFNVGALTVSAVDDLGGDIEYAFLNADGTTTDAASGFTIDGETGEIGVSAAPTYSDDSPAMNRRELIIQALDTSEGATADIVSTVNITILITPVSAITLESSAGLTIAVDESDNAPIDITTISLPSGLAAASVNPYTILGEPAGFLIDDDGGISASIDYEALTPSERDDGFIIIAQGEDSGGQFGIIILEIAITNIDDEAPVFDPIPTGASVEAGTTMLNAPVIIAATDSADGDAGDDAEITYALVDDEGAAAAPNASGLSVFGGFAIDAATGEITVDAAPEFSGNVDDNIRTLTIRATDASAGATGRTAADATIDIAVTAPGVLELRSSAGVSITINESDDDPIDVAAISIMTSGVSPAGTDPYAIAGDPEGFAIDDDGVITAQVDYEALSEAQRTGGISITVEAAGGEAGQRGSLALTIMVDNVDDEAPIFGDIPDAITVSDRGECVQC